MFCSSCITCRSKEVEPAIGKEIQVTVCDEEKVVCGVTKHTTCVDMIQALLEDHRSVPESQRHLQGEPKDFCLVERWKGFERALPPLTRILRLWYAWGDQSPFIQFILVKTSDFVPQPTKKATRSKGARPKRLEQGRAAQYAQSLPAEKQKRMVKKAFRKLEKLHNESKSSPGAEEVQRMVQLILDQDHTIREQIQRMRELDVGMERFKLEAQREASCGGQEVEPSEDQLQRYLYTRDGVEHLELQFQQHQELILQLSRDIDTELRRAAFPLEHDEEEEEQEGAACSSWTSSNTDHRIYSAELERLQEELKCSLFDGVSLHNQAAEMDKQLKYFDSTLVSKDQECWQLAAQLSSLQIGEMTEDESGPPPLEHQTQGCVSQQQTVKLKHSLSPLDIADTDSDTGISSTHSQDSLSPCLDSPPPLDTDV